jgi:hypothetical protein
MNAPVKTPTVTTTPTAMQGKHCMLRLSQQSYRLFIMAAEYLQSPLLLAIRL